jgi:hypothetical protein
MFRMQAFLRRHSASPESLNPGSDPMRAANPLLPQSRDFTGPTAAVLVALAGAGLVALGLLLVGTRQERVGFYMTPAAALVDPAS